MKKLRVSIEGKSYEVIIEVLDEGTATAAPVPPVSTPVASATVGAPVSAPPTTAGGAAPTGPGEVRSPLAGKIVSIDVKVGADIVEGTQVATIEAMKMNTYIFAPKSGRIAAVLVNSGEGVEEGALLLRIA